MIFPFSVGHISEIIIVFTVFQLSFEKYRVQLADGRHLYA